MRDVVILFALLMEEKLGANDHKRHWSSFTVEYLLRRLRQEVGELERAVSEGQSPPDIGREAADVANFAMMVADLAGGLPRIVSGQEESS